MKVVIWCENLVILYEYVLLYNLKEKIFDEEYVCCLEEVEMVCLGIEIIILIYFRMRYYVI